MTCIDVIPTAICLPYKAFTDNKHCFARTLLNCKFFFLDANFSHIHAVVKARRQMDMKFMS
ncbi:hypothetical protein MPTK1_2g06100 [Marchantia polymorpha subsp. ruderalis]|uniref:Uncharacterized protein n=1 Tax=Marchantia polymorpha TaxID=3197 RepID=A0A2R6XDL5_MARPO|nr:hypothetical protein MARPO_0021s0065 [Marchantia polymorpha]BBN01276.1 hypothetical protein Mp_2g06100 [Marchantia polymorpha subsp. ruderalis]|eukprot:PTQ44201.1 hypothetical protein MARPO_0021s0065 [Marchantia polymorpha]